MVLSSSFESFMYYANKKCFELVKWRC